MQRPKRNGKASVSPAVASSPAARPILPLVVPPLALVAVQPGPVVVGVGPPGPLVEIVVLSRHPLALALTSSTRSPTQHHSEGQPSEED